MKPNPVARIAVTIFFIGLLATPAFMRWRAAKRAFAAHAALDTHAALERHGFYLEEVSHAAGIDFVPVDCDWQSGDHAPEDSFYVWGPTPPDYFTHNAEA